MIGISDSLIREFDRLGQGAVHLTAEGRSDPGVIPNSP